MTKTHLAYQRHRLLEQVANELAMDIAEVERRLYAKLPKPKPAINGDQDWAVCSFCRDLDCGPVVATDDLRASICYRCAEKFGKFNRGSSDVEA